MIHILLISLIQQNLFAKVYGDSLSEQARCLSPTFDHGYVIAGSTRSFALEDWDALLIKVDSVGSVEWSRTYGWRDEQEIVSIIQTSDSGYIFVGQTTGSGQPGLARYDVILVKLSQDGQIEWGKTYGTTEFDFVNSFIQTADSGYLMVGRVGDYNNWDGMLIKTMADGSLDWAIRFTGQPDPLYEEFVSAVQTPDGGYAVAGYTEENSAGRSDVLLVKLSPEGTVEWAKNYGGQNPDHAAALTLTPDSGYLIAVSLSGYGAGQSEAGIIKVSSDGSLEWVKSFGGSSSDSPTNLIHTQDSGYVMLGTTESFGVGHADIFIIKLTQDATFEWGKTFGGLTQDVSRGILQTPDKGFVIAGNSCSFNDDTLDYRDDFLLFKVDSQGNYSGCTLDFVPTITNPNFMEHSVSIQGSFEPVVSYVNLLTDTPAVRVKDVCSPSGQEETFPAIRPKLHSITCVPGAGFVLFMSQEKAGITVYRADGRLAYRGLLKKGKNLVALERGVYFWQSGQQRGKAVVR